MKHLILLYELLRTRLQSQVSQSSQPRIPDIRDRVPREEAHSPALLEAVVVHFSRHIIMNQRNAENYVFQGKALVVTPPTRVPK